MSVKTRTSEAFELLYKALNRAQREAVDTIEGPVMVIAGPGTGKTTILTLRIANILRLTDTPANGILAITYTDAGVRAMRAKLREIIGDRAHEVRIHTFHSFAAGVIAEYPDHFLELSDMKQMSDIEQETLIRTIVSDPVFSDLRPSGKPDAYLSGILRSIDDAKREALTPDMVAEHASREIERIKNDKESISTRGATKGSLKAEAKEQIEKCERTILFAKIYERYEIEKRKSRMMDFNDLINELRLSFERDELLLRLIQERYLYVHVDEHQDTNDSQNLLITLIADFFETPNLFIVGDEKQAIYRFQGASVENFLLFGKRWPEMKLISLDTNYRSDQRILDASYGMIEHNYDGDEHQKLRVPLRSGRQKSSKKSDLHAVRILVGENVAAMEQRLVADLRNISEDEPDSTVAIIVRRNRDLDRVIRLLESHGIPVSSERSINIFSHPVGRLFFDILEYLDDPSRTDALAKTLVSGLWGLSFGAAAEIARSLRSGQVGLETKIPGLLHIRRMALNDAPVNFIVHIASESGFVDLVADDPSYIHVWRGIIALSESLVRDGSITDPAVLIRSLLSYRMSAETRPVKISVGAADFPIQAMTAHGSKGLEFDYVFVPYVSEESWIGKARGASFNLPRKRTTESDIHDARRLFYVALTRARESVTILSAQEESDGTLLTALRFVDELSRSNVIHEHMPRIGIELTVPNRAKAVSNMTPMVVMTKQVLLKKGLSVTALNHFIKCPNTFLYQSIFKLPQATSVPAEKGTAMHEAIAKVWRATDRSAKEIERIMNRSIDEYFRLSLLNKLEKESAKRELLIDIPAVAKALQPHFSQNGSVYTESWVETVFDGVYDGEVVNIPIHGKLDAIVDDGNKVSVYDYKTRRAMSIAAIKGETKSSQGDYMRQLVFYKILLSADQRFKGRVVEPSLVFVSPDEKGRCPTVALPIDTSDIDNVKKHIQSLIECVWSGSIAEMTCTDADCEWCGLRRTAHFYSLES